MGVRSTAAMTPLSDGRAKQSNSGYMTPNGDDNFQLACGNGQGNLKGGPGYSVAVTGKSRSSVNSSEEYIRETNAENKQQGIYKSTKTTFSPV